jgi:hypothetical protein
MKKLMLIAGVAMILAPLGACADGPYARSAGGVGVGVAYDDSAAVGYDGYYDDAYGPIYDGYWGDDGAFYYRDAVDHPMHRDDAHHFRHDSAPGFHPIHGDSRAGHARPDH